MRIDVVWMNEDRSEIARVGDPQMLMSEAVGGAIELSETVCLRFVDEYGDAYFNQFQIPVLTAELESAAALAPNIEVREHLLRVAELGRRAREVHTYLWFIGD